MLKLPDHRKPSTLFEAITTSMELSYALCPITHTKTDVVWEFPGGPVAKNSAFTAGGLGSNHGRGTKILQAMQPRKKKMSKIKFLFLVLRIFR